MLHNMLRAAAGRDRIPTDGLVAWYTMDNISGSTLVDEMGNYDGTITGASAVTGLFGDALSFSGNPTGAADANDYVESNIITFLGDFTISFWVDIDYALKASGAIIGSDLSGGAEDNNILIYNQSNNNDFGVYMDGTVSTGSITQLAEGWRHFIFTRTGSSVSVYIDLADVRSFTQSAKFQTKFIGTYRSGNSSVHTRWSIDQVRYYNNHLSASEREALYNE